MLKVREFCSHFVVIACTILVVTTSAFTQASMFRDKKNVIVKAPNESTRSHVTELLREKTKLTVVDNADSADLVMEVGLVFLYDTDYPLNLRTELPRLQENRNDDAPAFDVYRNRFIGKQRTTLTVFAKGSSDNNSVIWRKSKSSKISNVPVTPRSVSTTAGLDPLPPRYYEPKDNLSRLVDDFAVVLRKKS